MLEIGQDRKIAALISSVCVHLFFGGFMSDFMDIAVCEAKKAFKEGNSPIGAVVVRNGKVISKAHNRKNSLNISVYHAEIVAIIKACKRLKRWILDDCEIYVTLEPCAMCMNAIAESRIKSVYYLVSSDYDHNLNMNFNKISLCKLCDSFSYGSILSDFFKGLR